MKSSRKNVNVNMMSTSTDENTWRTQGFRQSMVNKIEEAISQCGASTSKNAVEMEIQVFSKAKSKDEYLSFVARLIIHIKEIGRRSVVPANNMVPQQDAGIRENFLDEQQQQQPNSNIFHPNMGRIPNAKEMGGPKKVGAGGPTMAGQQNPGQGNQLPQNMGMMNQMNQMGNMNMMSPQGMVPMNPNQSSMMQNMAQQQQPQQQQSMHEQIQYQQREASPQLANLITNRNQQLNQQQQQQMNQSQLSQSLMSQQQLNQQPNSNNQMGNMNMVHQQQGMVHPQRMNDNLHQQQQQQQFMQQQHLQNVQPGQMVHNSQVQLQDHMRNAQMGGAVQLGNVQIQNPAMSQLGASQIGNPQGGGLPGDNQIRAQLQNSQQQMHPQIPGGQIPPAMQNIIQQQQQQQPPPPQQLMGGRGSRMMGPQSAMAKGPQQRNIHRAPNVHNVNMPNQFAGPNAGPMSRNVTPSQYLPSPGNIGQTPSPGPPPNFSPAQSTLMPSPAAPGMTANNLRSFQGQHGVPSPGASLNTPLMAVSTPSPRNADDQACIDKIKELQKYTDLLQRMIAKIGNDDVEKSSKMKKLLEILTNPNQRVSMEILLKCEVALRKMERQQNDPGGVLGPTPQPPPMKSDQSQVSPFQQVLDALAGALRNPSSSHTLLRTFRPTVEALTGHSFGACFQNYEEEDASSDSESTENDIPPVLKRELRALDSHFKVSIYRRGGGMVRLRVSNVLDPKVPPLKINVRSDYPYDPPVVVHLPRDYGSTAFLKAVGSAYKSRFIRLTPNHTVTELLHLWHNCLGCRRS